jgi:DNA-binding Lrp family transcriptional regulator
MMYQDYVLPDTQLTMSAYEFNKALERVKADERERIIKIIEAYINPKYSEAWRPEIEQAGLLIIDIINGDRKQ